MEGYWIDFRKSGSPGDLMSESGTVAAGSRHGRKVECSRDIFRWRDWGKKKEE